MSNRKIAAGMVTAAVAAVGVATATAATSAPSKVTVKESQTLKVKVNRYVQDGLRFNKDVYTVKSGGTLKFVMTAPGDGPHTLSVVAKKDIPRTSKQILNCKICLKLAKAHGANPNSNAPPKFNYLENGVGSHTPPNLDRPGDSAVIFPKPGYSVTMHVTAKAGTVLHFICAIHPWMQAVLKVK